MEPFKAKMEYIFYHQFLLPALITPRLPYMLRGDIIMVLKVANISEYLV